MTRPTPPHAAPFLARAAYIFAACFLASTAHAQAPAPPQAPPVPVTIFTTVKRDVPIVLRNIGVVQAFQSAAIRPRVDGTLEQVMFTEGQEVKKGDLLARIDPRPYQAILDQAVARKAATAATLPLRALATGGTRCATTRSTAAPRRARSAAISRRGSSRLREGAEVIRGATRSSHDQTNQHKFAHKNPSLSLA